MKQSKSATIGTMAKIRSFATIVSLLFLVVLSQQSTAQEKSWLRINQIGYSIESNKVGVWVGKENMHFDHFEVIDSASSTTVLSAAAGNPYGAYGPFIQSYRLDFSELKIPGTYYVRMGETVSLMFKINDEVYTGAADFALQYLRQQRSGYNSFLKDSCHTKDGYTMYGPMPDSTIIDVSGGWHLFASKSSSAYQLGIASPGVSHTAPNLEAYFYEEDNWVYHDDFADYSTNEPTMTQQIH